MITKKGEYQKMYKMILFLLFGALITSLIFTGCGRNAFENGSSKEFGETNTEKGPIGQRNEDFNETVDETSETGEMTIPELEEYRLPGVFTLSKPKGWSVYKAGEYNTIAFLTRDENEPLRQVFCFGEIGLFYVSQQQKSLEQHYQDNNGYPIPWKDMPVISPFDGTTFFQKFNDIMSSQIARNFLAAGNMPKPSGFEQIQILSQEPIQSVLPGLPAVLIRALLVQNGKAAQGMFIVSGQEDGFGHATAFMVTGITAPIREYTYTQDSLLKVVRSFTMDASYVEAGVRTIQQNGEIFREISKTISETSDIITKGWAERNKSHDVIMQKQGDQIMGVERVYDPYTGEVYEVKNGFYDYYKTHEHEYTLKNLQPLPDDNFDLWEKAPRINHSLVSP